MSKVSSVHMMGRPPCTVCCRECLSPSALYRSSGTVFGRACPTRSSITVGSAATWTGWQRQASRASTRRRVDLLPPRCVARGAGVLVSCGGRGILGGERHRLGRACPTHRRSRPHDAGVILCPGVRRSSLHVSPAPFFAPVRIHQPGSSTGRPTGARRWLAARCSAATAASSSYWPAFGRRGQKNKPASRAARPVAPLARRGPGAQIQSARRRRLEF